MFTCCRSAYTPTLSRGHLHGNSQETKWCNYWGFLAFLYSMTVFWGSENRNFWNWVLEWNHLKRTSLLLPCKLIICVYSRDGDLKAPVAHSCYHGDPWLSGLGLQLGQNSARVTKKSTTESKIELGMGSNREQQTPHDHRRICHIFYVRLQTFIDKEIKAVDCSYSPHPFG